MIYAKIMDPRSFDWQAYEGDIEDDVAIDGGKGFAGIHMDDVERIHKMIDDYQGYLDYYYDGSIMAYLEDYLPKKTNGKRLSPREAHKIREALDKSFRRIDWYEMNVIEVCLTIIRGMKYVAHEIRGNSQGDYAALYAPEYVKDDEVSHCEALYFGTGAEIMVHDGDEEPKEPEDIYGYTFYTHEWETERIKAQIRRMEDRDEPVTLYEFKGYRQVPIYGLAE